MLKWALIFSIVAIVSAILGFGLVVGAAANIAKFLFVVFLVLAAAAMAVGYFYRRGMARDM